MVVRIGGEHMHLWRDVDEEGEVLDLLVQRRRDRKAAVRLMRKLVRKLGFAPTVLVTDKLRSYGAAFRDLGLSARHEQGMRKNNRAENSPSQSDDASARCSGSSQPDRPNASSQPMPRSTTYSTPSVILSPAAPCVPSGRRLH
ncbi:MAG: family transposase [Sphingomonas bacterium]|nr:family transposase [Sphingomonas bacterium]